MVDGIVPARRRQSAERLERLGLVNMVVPQEQMLAGRSEVAERVAANSPFAMGKLKTALNQQLGVGLLPESSGS